MQFAIPDSAVAAVLNRRLTARNLKKQSGNSFAYRPDRNVFDAILKLRSALVGEVRPFVIQLDFETYFDSIPHDYLNDLLCSRDVITTSAVERNTIGHFLKHSFAEKQYYQKGPFLARDKGTPQGSAISLSLANLANHPLDEKLEMLNGQFSRYADDTVVVCYTYEDALKAYQSFDTHCAKSGLVINRKKSPGICIFSDYAEEFRSIRDFKFLGYGMNRQGLFMHSAVETRLKSKLSNLINIYLLHYVERPAQPTNTSRGGIDFDWDLIGLLAEVRNILYGGLDESDLRQFISDGKKLRRMRGLMGFYALLDDHGALQRLDGWLISNIKQAYDKRAHVFKAKGGSLQTITAGRLVDGSWYNASKHNSSTFKPTTRAPSFVRGWAAARKYYFTYGLEDVEPPKYIGYYS